MRCYLRSFACFLAIYADPEVLAQQTPTQPPQRDPQASTVLSNAIAVMGGVAGLSQVRDCVAEGQFEQTENDSLVRGTFVWKNSGNKFRYETTRDGQTQIFASDGDSPAIRVGSNTNWLNAHTTMFHLPSHLSALVLFDQVTAGQASISLLEPATLAGQQVIRVQIKITGDPVIEKISSQIWSFDATTSLPLQVEYELPDHANAWRTLTVRDELSDFRSVSGVLVPFRIVSQIGAYPPRTLQITSLSFNPGVSPSEFTLP